MFVLARMSLNMGPKWSCSAKYRYIAKWELTREELASALVWDVGVGVGQMPIVSVRPREPHLLSKHCI